ncbi:MAG: TatD family hydrolase [Pyrinomonadaceae bacterium]|nr:TatD family hydrolase [Sphingobacteriaceae bacterium]
MVLTDTHTHLYYERDAEKRQALMERCLDNQVKRLFLPNVNTESIAMIAELTAEYPQNCFPMLGLHPCDVKENYNQDLATIKNSSVLGKIYAIGEIGIDLYWDKTTLEIQEEAFRAQIKWAKELDLPIVIHCRDAFEEVYQVLLSENDEKLRGIFHCFTGSKEQADLIIAMGFYIGIGGVVTYKNSGLDKVVEQISLESIVLETDSPYLTPVPFRGKPNESSYLTYIAEKIAYIKHETLQEVARITTENSKIIFGV